MKKSFFVVFLILHTCFAHAQSLSQGVFSASGSGSAGGNSIDWVLFGIGAPDQIYAALPVRLIYFKGNRTEPNTAQLTWKTTVESLNAGFEIQRSLDGKTFEAIGWIDGKGDRGGDYIFNDPNLHQMSYYRLKQVDLDGTYGLSKIVSVLPMNESVEIVTAYPNPAWDGKTRVRLPSNATRVRVMDASGTVLLQDARTRKADNVEVILPRKGLYLIQVSTPLETRTVKVVYQ